MKLSYALRVENPTNFRQTIQQLKIEKFRTHRNATARNSFILTGDIYSTRKCVDACEGQQDRICTHLLEELCAWHLFLLGFRGIRGCEEDLLLM